jgi:hypothetical protein
MTSPVILFLRVMNWADRVKNHGKLFDSDDDDDGNSTSILQMKLSSYGDALHVTTEGNR